MQVSYCVDVCVWAYVGSRRRAVWKTSQLSISLSLVVVECPEALL